MIEIISEQATNGNFEILLTNKSNNLKCSILKINIYYVWIVPGNVLYDKLFEICTLKLILIFQL